MRHEEYKQLLALEAVSALEEEERAWLEEHLPSCAECREELKELRDAAASLLYTLTPVQPSPGLRADILARVRAVDPSEVFVDPSEVVSPPQPVNPSEAQRRAVFSEVQETLRSMSLWRLLAWRPALGFGAA